MRNACRQCLVKTLNEVFADRTYQKDGTLTPRNLPGALITENSQMLAQCLQMFRSGTVTALSGETIRIKAETICIHGDGIHAVEFARSLNLALK